MIQHMAGISPRLGLLLVAGVAATGCNDLVGARDSATVSLSFAAPPATASATGSLSAAVIPITGGGHTLDIQKVDVIFSELVLERAEDDFDGDSDGDSDSDSDSDGPANEHFRSGPVTVNLPLEGGVITPFSTTVPVGRYEELEMDVDGVRIRGTFDGQAFDVVVPVDAELEVDFSPPFEVTTDADRLNITVAIDVLTWFREADGSVVDPRELATDSELRSRVLDRIEASFDAFEDSDRDADDADSDSDSD